MFKVSHHLLGPSTSLRKYFFGKVPCDASIINTMKLQIKQSLQFIKVEDVVVPDIFNRRIKTGVEDLDAAFGGQGFLPGSSFTLAGSPGAGKTTMLLQMLELLANKGKSVAYISGEEAIYQLAFTSRRLGLKKVQLANVTDVEDIEDAVRASKFDMVILDSFPSLTSRKKYRGRQLEEYLSNTLTSLAKETETIIGIILHITKQGQYKGSTLLPHSVDMNIMLTRNKEDAALREIEVTKNRFGWAGFTAFPISEKGFIFEKVEVEQDEAKPAAKTTKASQNKDAIKTFIGQHGKINIKEAVKLLGDLNKANHAFRELVLVGEVVKIGRGPTAVWRAA